MNNTTLKQLASIFEEAGNSIDHSNNRFVDGTWEKINQLILSLNLPEIEELPCDIKAMDSYYNSAFVDINEVYQEKILKGFIEISFINLYPNTISSLYQGGRLLPKSKLLSDYCTVSKLRNDFRKMHKEQKISYTALLAHKIWINYMYGKFGSLGYDGTKITNFTGHLMEEFSNIPGWIYGDTDTFYFNEPVLTDEIKYVLERYQIPYEVRFVKSGVFFRRKKLILEYSDELKYKGFRPFKMTL